MNIPHYVVVDNFVRYEVMEIMAFNNSEAFSQANRVRKVRALKGQVYANKSRAQKVASRLNDSRFRGE